VIQIFPDTDLVAALDKIVTPGVFYTLYTNNVTPTDSNVLGDFTQWQGGAGPTPQVIHVLLAAFTLSGVSGHIGKITANDITFTNLSGAPITVYGYIAGLTDAPGPVNDLLLAARFDTAPITLAPGDNLNVTPTLSLRSAS
jgi:hypothetical protein